MVEIFKKIFFFVKIKKTNKNLIFTIILIIYNIYDKKKYEKKIFRFFEVKRVPPVDFEKLKKKKVEIFRKTLIIIKK